MKFLKISALALSITMIAGCNDDNKTTKNTHTEQPPAQNIELPTLSTSPMLRGQLFTSQYTTDSTVHLTDSTGLQYTTQSMPNSHFRLAQLSASALNQLKLDAQVCLDAALTQCLRLTHQLSGKYAGEIIPLDLRTTLIDLLIKNHNLQIDSAQQKVNQYFNLENNISKLSVIPAQFLDQEKVLEDFAASASQSKISLDQYLIQLAANIVAQPELQHQQRISTTFKPKLNGKQLIEEAILQANDPSLLTLLSTPQVQNNSQVQAKIDEKMRYFNATLDSMQDINLRLNDLHALIAPTMQKLEQDYKIRLIQQNPEQFKEFINLTKSVIFDLNQLQYLTDAQTRLQEIKTIEVVLEHLMFKRDEISLNLQSTYQNQIALNIILTKDLGINEQNLKQISQYLADYMNYYDHVNAFAYYLLAEELKYHSSTLTSCTPQTDALSAEQLDTSVPYCALYQHYLTQRNQYFSSDFPPLQLQSGANPITSINGINASDLASLDLETALLAVQSQRANLLDAQWKDQLELTQAKNSQMAQLNTLLSLSHQIIAGFPKTTDADYQTRLARLSETFQSSWDNAEKTVCGTVLCYFNKSIVQSEKPDWEKLNISIKSQIDSVSNTQTMEILRLQSLSNKRNEAFEVLTNFINTIQDSRNNIIENMR